MTGPAEPPTPPGSAIVGLLVCGFVVADLVFSAMLWKTESPGFGGLVLGGVAGQFGLLTIWAVFGPQRWTSQLPVTLGVAVLLFAVVILGMIAVDPSGGPAWRDLARAFLLLPLVFLSAQLPLWIARYLAGWRIVRTEAETSVEAAQSRQFGLGDLLGAMVVLAIALGLASWGLSGEPDFGETWTPFLLGCLLCATWTAFSTLPCLWACFVARSLWAGAMVIAVYVPVMTAVFLAVGTVLEGSGPPAAAIAGALMFHVGIAGVILGVLHVFRCTGYVLRRVADRRQKTPPGIGAPGSEPSEPSPPSELHEAG